MQAVQAIDYSKYDVGDLLPKEYDTDTPTWGANRRAGVILHPTCLPGPNGIGEIGGAW
jgi:4-alpha-glucanotransferase